jgi:hypothetical protein
LQLQAVQAELVELTQALLVALLQPMETFKAR